ncbi:MAG: phasin family protein, partial [Pseudomonadaceae bacterium]|nr:phasin family protein [Pseudomonadaceae bacterium]
MAGKKKIEKEVTTWVNEVEKYSRQIWLAGLGAYSKVSKDGEKLFDGLVTDGEKAEKLAKAEVTKQVGVVKSSVGSAKSKVEEVKEKAWGKWSELEDAFDKRLNNAISRLGVPSRNEVKELHSKVEVLTKQIEKLTGVSAQSVKPAVKAVAKPAVKKPVAKPVAAKPAAKPAVKAVAKPAAAKPAAKPAVKAV